MRPLSRLVFICFITAGTAALVSHALARWLGLRTQVLSTNRFGTTNVADPVFLGGSSLTFYDLDWTEISSIWGRQVRSFSVPSASTCELEIFQSSASNCNSYVIGLSIYDLNERFLCDFRGEVVPLGKTCEDLMSSHLDWSFKKRVLGQYPLQYLRLAYPTAGRSLGVMVGMREKLGKFLRLRPAETLPTLSTNEAPRVRERISDWAPGRTLRNLSQLRAGCQGKHEFDGPKHLSLKRMLRTALDHGGATIIVLPVSPPYEQEFVTKEVAARFEQSLTAVQREFPAVKWIRLDQIPELHSRAYFWDLVHLNVFGRSIATRALLNQLKID